MADLVVTCWLCRGLGGISKDLTASDWFERTLLVASARTENEYVAWRPCPVCENLR